MEKIENLWGQIAGNFNNAGLPANTIAAVLLVVTVLSLYEYLVYRLVSHRAFYNKSFNICLAVLPYFISTIILCLQSNLVITLGTIGALAILRFRTAVKDPVDMMYLLWAVHIGITCGCQLYEVAVLTSLAVTIVLLVLENVKLGGKPVVLIVHCEAQQEEALMDGLKGFTRKYRVKSRNYTDKGIDFVIEFSARKAGSIADAVQKAGIVKFSVLEYDTDDII